MKILLVGQFGPSALENSYQRAFRELGHEVEGWDAFAALNRRLPLRNLGWRIAHYFAPEPWIKLANRDLLTRFLADEYQLVLFFGATFVSGGTLGQMRLSRPHCRLALYWPDPLYNLPQNLCGILGLFDHLFTFTRSTLPFFERFGPRAHWLPFACDPHLFQQSFPSPRPLPPTGEVVLIGNYRPEREDLVVHLHQAGIPVQIWGSREWSKYARHRPLIRRSYTGLPVFGAAFAKVVREAKIVLNPIDATAAPGANMKFFEIPAAGGLALHSSCPEWEEEYPNNTLAVFFGNAIEACQIAIRLLQNEALCRTIRLSSKQHTLTRHTYLQRSAELLKSLDAQ